MRAGLLRSPIVIQSFTVTVSASGQQTKAWTAFAHRRASVSHLRARELADLGILKTEQPAKFTLRYLSGVTEQMRILYGGSDYADGLTDAQLETKGYRIYSITSVIDVEERNRMLEVAAVLERK